MSSAHPIPTPDAEPAACERRLRRATGMAGAASLLRFLGFPAAPRPLSRAERLRAGIARSLAPAVVCLDEHPPAYLAEVATDEAADCQVVAEALHRLADEPFLLLCAGPGWRTLSFGCRGADGEYRQLRVQRLRPARAELDALVELARAGTRGLARVFAWSRALDRGTITGRFFRDIRAQRDALAAAWSGLPARLESERHQLSLLLLSRLLFLCFLQERGHLLGDRDFLGRQVRDWRERGAVGLYRTLLRPLFFGVFNTRPGDRASAAVALGALPYLNGGLFEPHALERRHAGLDLPDAVLLRVFPDLLDRYRFTARDAADTHADALVESGIDPEVLGRVFEGLMAAGRRGDTGTFYTPAAVVDRLVTQSLVHLLAGRTDLPEAALTRLVGSGDVLSPTSQLAPAAAVLRELRVLDPACGSGAFLLGALSRIARARGALEPGVDRSEVRRAVVAHSLHGVDLLDDAALLCALRLWLALAPGEGEPVTPLPNLDRRIRQGDALVDPLDLLRPGAAAGPQRSALYSAEVRRAVRALEPLGREYLAAEPDRRPALLAQLRQHEYELARLWLGALARRLERSLRERSANAAYRDLWGAPLPDAGGTLRERERLHTRLAETERLLRELEDSRALPFFSFLVHFAAERAGFDVILANPPWVRAHRWPAGLAGVARERFRVCREAGWPGARALVRGGSGPGGQVDLALLFLERAVHLLADRGVLGMLLPAKLLRSLFAGGARALLLGETALLEIDDHGLDQHSVFDADAFTVGVVARRTADAGARDGTRVRITLRNRGREPLAFELPQRDLPLIRGDVRAPWLLAPPRVAAALRHMQAAGTPLGLLAAAQLRRGVVTGANDVLVVTEAEHRLGGLSRIRAQGWFRARRAGDAAAGRHAAWVETSALRPLLRGATLAAWRWSAKQYVLWVPANDSRNAVAPPRLERYLARHRDVLGGRTGAGGQPAQGRLLRVSPALLGHKVVWQDIALDLNAAAVPATVRGPAGTDVPVIPLNTVYFLGVRSERDALLLAGLLNSLPLRVFARAIAERAKDARFRFFAWTVAALPVVADWEGGPAATEIEVIARVAQRDRGIAAAAQQRLDQLVAQAYGLGEADLAAFREFDAWLRR